MTALLKRPFDCSDAQWKLTEAPPALWPVSVTVRIIQLEERREVKFIELTVIWVPTEELNVILDEF